MQVSELYELTQWVKLELVGEKIQQKYDALIKILNANVRRGNNQPAQSFEEAKLNLVESLSSVNLNVLTLSQINTLREIGIKENIGKEGEAKILNIMSNVLDIANVTQKISEMKNELQKGITKTTELEKSLMPFVHENEHELSSKQILTRVIFEDEASVKNINELKAWSSKWFDIGRGFAIANGQTPEDVKVIGGARGSLIIELALLATTALPLAKAINLTLDSMVKFKDFQLKATEVRKLKDDNPNLIEELEGDAERWESRAEQLKKDIANDISEKIEESFSNYQSDNKAELNKAIKTLVDFISKGGDVDCVVSDEKDDIPEGLVETMRLLKSDFSEIRELKETLLLEHKKANK